MYVKTGTIKLCRSRQIIALHNFQSKADWTTYYTCLFFLVCSLKLVKMQILDVFLSRWSNLTYDSKKWPWTLRRLEIMMIQWEVQFPGIQTIQ